MSDLMITIIKKWGNSLVLKIPNSLAKDMQLSQGSVVEVAVAGGRMLIKPKEPPKISLTHMLKGITKGNLHAAQDCGGGAPGQETL